MSPFEAIAIFLLSIGASVVQATTGLGFGLMVVPPLILVVGDEPTSGEERSPGQRPSAPSERATSVPST